MSQSEKAGYYRALKDNGVKFDRHYREYSTEELKKAYDRLRESIELPPEPQQPTATFDAAATAEALQQLRDAPPGPSPEQAIHPDTAASIRLPVRERDPNELPGQRLNNGADLEPIRVDEQGRIWYQEEVAKPAYPKPRGRRVLKYMDTGTETQTVKNGDYVESFEVAGRAAPRPAEVKITLPSYQVGIFKDPRFPFRIHTYGGRQAFDLFEVQNFYGGAELVPSEIKRVYIENVLCYDIRTTIRAIQTEFRQLQLAGKVK